MRGGFVLAALLVVACGGRVSDSEGGARGPALVSLDVGARLVPSFDPKVSVYDVELQRPTLLPLPTLTVRAVPTPADAPVTVGGVAAPPGVATEVPVPTGRSTVDVLVDGSRYTLRVNARVEQPITYFKASNTFPSLGFGTALALDGDTLVVGQHWDTSGATGVGGSPFDTSAERSGAVFVYTRRGGIWTEQAYIKPPDTHPEQTFGLSVALKGDVLLVGAPGDSRGTGAAFVYRRSAGTWSLEAKLGSSVPVEYRRFGDTVALDTDTVAVTDNSRAAVEIFEARGGGAWTRQTRLEGVGYSMAFDHGELAATTIDNHAVHVYARRDGAWADIAQMSLKSARDTFGTGFAFAGDTIAANARRAPSPSTGPTSTDGVFVYRRANETTWVEEAVLTEPASLEEEFGATLALRGDVLAVGAPGERSNTAGFDGDPSDDSTRAVGAVLLYSRSGATWIRRAYLKASNAHVDGRFGHALALGPSSLVVGAPGDATLTRGINGPQSPFPIVNCGAAYGF